MKRANCVGQVTANIPVFFSPLATRPSPLIPRRAPLILALICILLSPLAPHPARHLLAAENPVRLFEAFAPGYQYHVSCRVNITGTLKTSEAKDKQLTLTGSSAIEFDERVLVEKDHRVDKTIRVYQKMDFERTVGEQRQHSSLRPAVRRMVILRHNQFEVPFSPEGPLTWGEIDLVRTDVFTPALAGLLPTQAAKPGDRWQADTIALKELTDLEQITDGGLTCTFDALTTLVGRQQARISFHGTVRGVGEDGTARHELEGQLYFDLVSNHLSYLHVKGTHYLLDKNGQEQGHVQGTFVLTREPVTQAHALTDADLRGVALEPNDDNTLLLFEQMDLGVRLLYPRRWRVAGVSGRQIALDEKNGNGLLLTLELATKLPTAAQFHQEARGWLTQQKANVYRMDSPKALASGLDNFAVDADIKGQRLVLDYYVLRQDRGGATIVARLAPADLINLRKDVERIIKSVQLTKVP
jgi:hypothetical protein